MLIHPDHRDALEPVRVIDQHPPTLGQDRGVSGVPRDPEPGRDPGHREVVDHDRLQRPGQATARELGARRCGNGGVLTPHAPTVAAAVALDTDQQRRRTVTEGLVSQSARHGPARDALGATDPTPWIRLSDPALDHRPIRLDPLPDSDEPELVQAAEQREVRVSEGSVMHVEVFQMGCVGTPIIGGPRRLPGPDPLHPRSRRAGMSPRVECSRRELYQSTHPAVTHSTSSIVLSGPDRNGDPSRIASFLNSPIVDSARALMLTRPRWSRSTRRCLRARESPPTFTVSWVQRSSPLSQQRRRRAGR